MNPSISGKISLEFCLPHCHVIWSDGAGTTSGTTPALKAVFILSFRFSLFQGFVFPFSLGVCFGEGAGCPRLVVLVTVSSKSALLSAEAGMEIVSQPMHRPVLFNERAYRINFPPGIFARFVRLHHPTCFPNEGPLAN